MQNKKVALVHDYIDAFGGAERVLLSLTEIFPEAPIYTIYKKENSDAAKYFKNKKIIQSWFGYLPFANKLISPLRFLIPFIWIQFNFKKYDLVITSSAWAVTKGMRNAKMEISYIHTPPRYLYGYSESKSWGFLSPFVKFYGLVVNHFMRLYDFNQAQKPDLLIANSINVQKRIKKFYRRESEVIYPPIDFKKFSNSNIKSSKGDYYLTGGRLVKHKNFDKIIKAFLDTEYELVVFGSGPEENYLKKLASKSKNIKFIGKVSDSKLISLYKGASAFIVASKDEDLGMTPLEAQSAGCPVIAYKAEGYLETVVEGITGIFIKSLKEKSIMNAVQSIESKKWNKKELQNFAKKFSEDRFKKEILKIKSKIYL